MFFGHLFKNMKKITIGWSQFLFFAVSKDISSYSQIQALSLTVSRAHENDPKKHTDNSEVLAIYAPFFLAYSK